MSSSDGSGGRQLRLELALNDFEHFLTADKGLSVTTRGCYVRHVLPFLTGVGGPVGVVDLGGVSAQRVRSYVTDLGGRYSPQSLKLIATAIRSFLGFAWMSGWTGCDLRPAVGVVVTHRFGHLPKALPAEDLRRLLAVPDRRTTMGSRDYALLVVLSRLGLRAGEVAGLRLDDFNWRAATVTSKVKGGRRLCLPIPHDVGQAVVAYLNRRPAGVASREAFLQVRGGPTPMTGRAVSQVVARYAARAGLGTVRAHRLRHSAARAVLSAGGSLTEVGELLGHANGQVTMSYASFELRSLAVLARPGRWRSIMRELATLISDYMDFRAARGFRPNRKTEHLLTQFADTLSAERDDGLLFSQGEALAWAHAPVGGHPGWLSARLSTVRGFAIYLAGSGLPVGVPAVRQGVGGSRRATPYLYSFNDIRALMTTAHQLFTPLRAATMTTLVGLLAVTGMRIGETVRLTVGDVDLDQGVVLIAHAKFGRQRMVRLDPSSCDALAGYLSVPARRRFGTGPKCALFVTQKGTAVNEHTARGAFHQMVQHAGLPARAGARPRPTTFATRSRPKP